MPETTTAQKLPPLMHFPLAKHLASTQGLSIRRVGWTGKTGAHELAWIRYTGGLWWYQNASGERVAESGDVDEHDLLALDWTTLAPDCDPAEHQDAGLPADATVFGIRPYDLWEDVDAEAGLRDLTNPNAELGATRCESPTIVPPRPPVIVPPPGGGFGEGSGTPEGGTGTSGGGIDVPLGPPPPEIPGGSSGGSTTGSGGSGGGGRRRRRPSTPNQPLLPTATLDIHTGSPIGGGCIQRAKDGCGRRCRDAPDPIYDIQGAGLAYEYLGATISLGPDQAQPGSVWFYRYYYKGELRETGTIAPGSSKDVDGGVRQFDLALGASHTGRVEFSRGSDTVAATATITMPNYCAKDPECGKPCPWVIGGGGGGGGGGSDWGGSW